MEELTQDIKNHKKITASAAKYIKYRKLKKCNYSPNLTQISIGSIFLIKKNSIIELYSHYMPETTFSPKHSLKQSYWVCHVEIINIDPSESIDIAFILSGYEKIYHKSNGEYLIKMFVDEGFNVYTV